MRFVTNRSLRFCLVFFVMLVMAIGGSVAAFAAGPTSSSTNAQVAVGAGSLTESGPTSVSATPVTLTGDDQTTTYALGITVTDATGSGTGWNLTISSSQFTGANPANTLPAGASSIQGAPTVACSGTGTHCTSPNNGISYPMPVGSSAGKFFNAAAGSGLGKFTITPTVTVAIPGNTYADTYTSTVSVAIVSGP